MDHTPFDALNECKYLFLRSISEPEERSLCVQIEEATTQREISDREIRGVLFSGMRAIESSDHCRLFELRWETYVAYTITNESFALPDDKEFALPDDKEQVEWGSLVRLLSKSSYLKYVVQSTFAQAVYPERPFQHIAVCCQNHILDVVSFELRTIRQLRPAE